MDKDRAMICEIISEMLDSPNKHGIYPTGACYARLERYIEEQRTEKTQEKVMDGTMDESAKKEKEPQVVEWSQRLEKSITETSNRLYELADRLESIMREPQIGQEERDPQTELVPFAAEIRNREQEVTFILYRIEDILDRLEI